MLKRSLLVLTSFFGVALLVWILLSYLRCFWLFRIGSPDAPLFPPFPMQIVTLFFVEGLLLVGILSLVARKAFLSFRLQMMTDPSFSLEALDMRRVVQSGIQWALLAVAVSSSCSIAIYFFFVQPEGDQLKDSPLVRFLMPQGAEQYFLPDRLKTFAEGRGPITEAGRAAAHACVYGQWLLALVAMVIPYVKSAREFEREEPARRRSQKGRRS